MVQYLAVKIGHVHHIAVDEADCADTGCGQIECCRRTKASSADEKNLSLGNLLLPLATNLRQKNMPAVSVYLIFSKFHVSRDAENDPQLRSRFEEILNGDPAASPLGGAHRLGAPYSSHRAPQGVRLRFLLACGLVGWPF
jgi:hypothetical protein